jgi:hypothetical protein
VQTCDASQIQTIPNRNNTAVVLQVIISQNPPSPQDGTQVVKLRQTALGTGSNTAGIAQYVKQSLGPGTPEDTEEGDSEPDEMTFPRRSPARWRSAAAKRRAPALLALEKHGEERKTGAAPSMDCGCGCGCGMA